MPHRMLILSDNRKLFIGSLETSLDDSIRAPFAALVPAFDAAERQKVEAIVGSLLARGCVELSCVGPQAEELHDSLDGIIEDRGDLQVATTWHTDYADACEYLLFAAGGGSPTLLALVSAHPDLSAVLENETH